jgi:hypothetical protein
VFARQPATGNDVHVAPSSLEQRTSAPDDTTLDGDADRVPVHRDIFDLGDVVERSRRPSRAIAYINRAIEALNRVDRVDARHEQAIADRAVFQDRFFIERRLGLELRRRRIERDDLRRPGVRDRVAVAEVELAVPGLQYPQAARVRPIRRAAPVTERIADELERVRVRARDDGDEPPLRYWLPSTLPEVHIVLGLVIPR